MRMGEKLIPKVGNAGLFSGPRFWVLCAADCSACTLLRAGMGMGTSKVKVKVACFSHLAPSPVVSELGIAWKWGEVGYTA